MSDLMKDELDWPAKPHRTKEERDMFSPRKPYVAQDSIESRFRRFHKQNLHVYAKLRDMALSLHASGHERWSIKGLFEVVRWQWAIKTNAADFKLNNDFTALYARLIMERCPKLEGFFELRKIRAC